MKIGDKVRMRDCEATRLFNQSKKIYTIRAIIDHTPCDGPTEKDCIVLFEEDNSWEFIWNLLPIEEL